MITDFFAETKPAYIAVNADGFTVNGKTQSEIQGFIRQIIPVRKLFNGRKLLCYSNDAVKGKNGEHCSLCPRQSQCRKRIRLMLLLQDGDGSQIPAQFEINSTSFDNLREMLEPIDEKELPQTLISMHVSKTEKYIQVSFSALF